MTLDERMAKLDDEMNGIFEWSESLAAIRRHIREATDEAVAAKEREWASEIDPAVCRLQFPDGTVPGNAREAAEGWVNWAHKFQRERDQAKAELAALRVPVGKVTTGEASGVINAHLQATPGDCLSETAKAIDALIAPRVAQAVEAERLQCARESHSDLEEARERHAAELAQMRKLTDMDQEIKAGEAQRTASAVAEADQRWQTRTREAVAEAWEEAAKIADKEINEWKSSYAKSASQLIGHSIRQHAAKLREAASPASEPATADKFKIDPDWLLKMAEKENNCVISVGGLVSDSTGLCCQTCLQDVCLCNYTPTRPVVIVVSQIGN